MKRKLSIRYFAHSWVSDWNHGNAHFLRGLARSLMQLGNEVRCYEQLGSWSLRNLVSEEADRATSSIDGFRAKFPQLDVRFYDVAQNLDQFLRKELKDADVVIIHEWNDPVVVNSALAYKGEYGFRALFHDTHHRAYTSPGEILQFQLNKFDGVLAFGAAIRQIYVDGFGIPQTWVFHEAADVEDFKPLDVPAEMDVLWIGNWGDEERTQELQEFLIGPAVSLKKAKFVVHGVRYPAEGLRKLKQAGIEYRGYLPNLACPEVYARTKVALHVPRRQYANGLSGIPTIRVFEALACGVPLVCSPWTDLEGLFRSGEDFLTVPDQKGMVQQLRWLLQDELARQQIARNGLATVRTRHTCDHRAQQLMGIFEDICR